MKSRIKTPVDNRNNHQFDEEIRSIMSVEPSDPPVTDNSEISAANTAEKPEESTPALPTSDDQEPAPETEQSEPSQTDENAYGSFPPGTIVLGKLKSFPPWPGIVIPYELVPEGVNKSKPKHPTQPRPSKKKNQHSDKPIDTRLWCVRFLRDDTYMWGGVNEISLLTKEQIEKFLNDKKGKKLIKSAYEMALNPPDVEEFIIWGSNGKPIQIDNEINDADFEDEEGDGQSVEDDDGEDDDEEDEDLEELKQPVKKSTKRGRAKNSKSPAKKQKTSTPKKTKGKPGRKPGKRKTPEPEPEPETSSDEDWDVDDETEPPVAENIPSAKQLSDDLKKRTPLVKKARVVLQDFFLESKELETDVKSLKQVNTILDSLEKNPEVQLSLVKHYSLHRVMFDILKRPDLIDIKDVKKMRERISKLVEIWFDTVIEPTENWNFEEKVEEIEENNGELKQEENGKEENSLQEEVKENGVKEEETSEPVEA